MELRMDGLPGAAYTVEVSTDLVTWVPAGVRRFGTGVPLVLAAAGEPAVAGGPFFRVREEVEAPGGLAPWNLSGRRLRCNVAALSGVLAFGPAASFRFQSPSGEAVGTFAWLRTGEDEGRLTLTWPNGARDEVALEFAAAACGRAAVKRMAADGTCSGGGSGTFGDEAEGVESTAPAALGSSFFVLAGQGRARLLRLLPNGQYLENDQPAGQWTYQITGGSTAQLRLARAGGGEEELVWTMTGPMCGRCVCRDRRDGVMIGEMQARFSVTPAP